MDTKIPKYAAESFSVTYLIFDPTLNNGSTLGVFQPELKRKY